MDRAPDKPDPATPLPVGSDDAPLPASQSASDVGQRVDDVVARVQEVSRLIDQTAPPTDAPPSASAGATARPALDAPAATPTPNSPPRSSERSPRPVLLEEDITPAQGMAMGLIVSPEEAKASSEAMLSSSNPRPLSTIDEDLAAVEQAMAELDRALSAAASAPAVPAAQPASVEPIAAAASLADAPPIAPVAKATSVAAPAVRKAADAPPVPLEMSAEEAKAKAESLRAGAKGVDLTNLDAELAAIGDGLIENELGELEKTMLAAPPTQPIPVEPAIAPAEPAVAPVTPLDSPAMLAAETATAASRATPGVSPEPGPAVADASEQPPSAAPQSKGKALAARSTHAARRLAMWFQTLAWPHLRVASVKLWGLSVVLLREGERAARKLADRASRVLDTKPALVRQAVGAIGAGTTVYAVLVWSYVLIVRKPAPPQPTLPTVELVDRQADPGPSPAGASDALEGDELGR